MSWARGSTLLVRVEDVVLRLHGHMAYVPAVGFGLVGCHLAGRGVMIEESVSPAAGLRKPLAVLLDEESSLARTVASSVWQRSRTSFRLVNLAPECTQ